MGTLADGRPVVVVGAGLTGASWAGLFAAAGLEVRLLDRDLDRAGAGAAQAEEAARFLAANGLADGATTERGVTLLGATDQPAAACADVQLLQECVVERLDVKRAVFALAEAHAPMDALLATSSSGLSITAIQEGLVRPERSLAAHPYNPPHLVPLVELAPGERTAPGTMDRAEGFYRSVGKEPVVLRRDLPGYIGNRLSAALWREAVALVLAGDASVDDVDRTVRFGPGLRWAAMGPHLLYHLGGGAGGIRGHLEHLGGVKEGMLRDLADWTTFPEATADLLEAGVREEIGDRSEADLARERDASLVAFRRILGTTQTGPVEPTSLAEEPGPWPTLPVAPGVTRTTLVVGRHTHLVRFDLQPGAVIPLHRHPHEQTGFLVDGDLVLTTPTEERPYRPGDSWSIAGGQEHGARSAGGAAVVEAFSPPREDYL